MIRSHKTVDLRGLLGTTYAKSVGAAWSLLMDQMSLQIGERITAQHVKAMLQSVVNQIHEDMHRKLIGKQLLPNMTVHLSYDIKVALALNPFALIGRQVKMLGDSLE